MLESTAWVKRSAQVLPTYKVQDVPEEQHPCRDRGHVYRKAIQMRARLRSRATSQILIFLKKYLFIWVFFAGPRLLLVAESRGYSLAVVCGLLVAVASLGVEHGLQGTQASAVVAQQLSCPVACGIFRDQRSTHVSCIGRRIFNHWTTCA